MNPLLRQTNVGLVNRFDTGTALLLNRSLHLPGVQLYFGLVSYLGDGKFWYALMLGMAAASQTVGPQASLHMALVGLAVLLVYKLCKKLTLRPRPYAALEEILLGASPLDQYSFPSGHTMHAVAFTLVALHYFPHLSWLLIPFTVSVALSRVILGLHYPTDVAWGAGLGLLIGKISLMPLL